MRIGYVQAVNSAVEFQQIIEEMKNVGIEAQNIFVNPSFSDFATTLNHGDVLVIKSLCAFNSIAELFIHTIALLKREITVQSIDDPWFAMTQNQITLLQGFSDVSRKLRSSRSTQSLDQARAAGKKLGRPRGTTQHSQKVAEAQRLHRTEGLSITKACKIAGCQPRTYYRHCKKAVETV